MTKDIKIVIGIVNIISGSFHTTSTSSEQTKSKEENVLEAKSNPSQQNLELKNIEQHLRQQDRESRKTRELTKAIWGGSIILVAIPTGFEWWGSNLIGWSISVGLIGFIVFLEAAW